MKKGYELEFIKNSLYFKIRRDCKIHTQISLDEACDVLSIDKTSIVNFEKVNKKFTAVVGKTEYFVSGCLMAIEDSIFWGNRDLDLLAKSAYKMGASAFIATKQYEDFPCLIVDDVNEAYSKIINYIRKKLPEVKSIGVTGSIGKTTTTEMLKTVYSSNYKIFTSQRNRNTLSATGRYIQSIDANAGYERYIQEVHEGDVGSCRQSSLAIVPNYVIITNIAFSHLERFESKEAFVNEFSELTCGMPDDGVVVFNGDDENLCSIAWDRNAVSVGLNNPNVDFYVQNVETYPDKTAFDIKYDNDKIQHIVLNIPGKHNVIDAALVFATAYFDGISVEHIVRGLANYKTSGIRQNLLLVNGCYIYLDCYNAAPLSMKSAIDTISMMKVAPNCKKIAVLGDMNELGDDSENLHAWVGNYVANSDIDILIAYGKNPQWYLRDIDDSLKAISTKNKKELDNILKRYISKGDIVLFKASNSVHLINRVMKRFPLSIDIKKAFIKYYF